MKYNIPTLMALCQDTEVPCNWTGHVKDCKLLRPDRNQKLRRREPSRKRFNRSKSNAGSRLSQLPRPTPKEQNIPTLKRNTTPPPSLTSTDAGFARFLKEHSSPTHQRVTAGGRIVPMDTMDSLNQEEKNFKARKRPAQLQLSPSPLAPMAGTANGECPPAGLNITHTPVSFVLEDETQKGALHQIPVNISQMPVPMPMPMPIQPFMSPVCPQQSAGFYEGVNLPQMDNGYQQSMKIDQELNHNPAGPFRSTLDHVHKVVNGIEDPTFVEFQTNLRFLVDLVGRPVDSIRVEYLIFLHNQMEIALNAASRHLQLVDAEIAMSLASDPSHVKLRIKWTRIRSEVLDRLEEIKRGLGEAIDRFDGVSSVTISIIKTLYPDIPYERLLLSHGPRVPYEPETYPEAFQPPFPQSEIGPKFIPHASDSQPVAIPQIFGDCGEIERPGPEHAGRFDDISMDTDLYGDKNINESMEILSVDGEQTNEVYANTRRLEHSTGEDSEGFESMESQIQDSHISGQTDGVAEGRTPRLLPRNLRRRDSHTLPRNFPRRFSNLSPLAAERRPSSQYFHMNWHTMRSVSGSTSSSDVDDNEASQLEDCEKDEEPLTIKKHKHSKLGAPLVPELARLIDVSSDGHSDQSDISVKDVDYDADVELSQEPCHRAIFPVLQSQQTKAIRAELRAMQGIGQNCLPTGRPTVKTFATNALGLPGRFQYESGWMGLSLKKLLP